MGVVNLERCAQVDVSKDLKRGGEQFVAEQSLVRGNATESVAQLAGALRGKGRPHLQKAIREPGLENSAGDGREDHLVAQVDPLPHLFPGTPEEPERLRLLGA